MAPQDHQVEKLVKVGLEGFALLDEAYGWRKKSPGSRAPMMTTTATTQDHYHYYNYSNQQPYVYSSSQIFTAQELIIDSNKAARFYGGKSIVDYSMKKTISRVY